MFIGNMKNIIISIFATMVIMSLIWVKSYVDNLNVKIKELQSKVKDVEKTLVICVTTKKQLQSKLYEQNEKIKSIEVDRQKAIKKLQEWKAKPEKIRYNTIIKYKIIKSNECKDIKKVLKSIRVLDYKGL